MADELALSALSKKYADLLGELREIEKQGEKIVAALAHVDATIRMFKGDYNTALIKPHRHYRRRNPYFKKGVYLRVAMDILRESKQPLTAREIASLVCQQQGMGKEVQPALQGLYNGLRQKAKEGRLIAHKEHHPIRFSIPRT